MRHDKLGLQLELLLLLTENRQWTVDMICEHLNIQKRNLYYYLDFFKSANFGVQKRGGYYYISRQSPFVSKLCDVVNFTDAEAVTLRHVLDGADGNDLQVRSIKKKLERFFDFDIIEESRYNKHQAIMVRRIYDAIYKERKIIIRNYSSPNSSSVTDRQVEPFLLFNGSHDLRAYELSSGVNKTFRISRMGDVEVLEESWSNKSKHRQMFTDIFNFSGEQPVTVKLLLDQLSYNVLIEEYPRAERYTHNEIDDKHWLFAPSVCSMLGIGRFVLGLYDHIKIIDSPELEAYVHKKLEEFIAKD